MDLGFGLKELEFDAELGGGNCIDLDRFYADGSFDDLTDSGGDGCDYYVEGITDVLCGLFDDFDFTASELCCACGGGETVVAPYEGSRIAVNIMNGYYPSTANSWYDFTNNLECSALSFLGNTIVMSAQADPRNIEKQLSDAVMQSKCEETSFILSGSPPGGDYESFLTRKECCERHGGLYMRSSAHAQDSGDGTGSLVVRGTYKCRAAVQAASTAFGMAPVYNYITASNHEYGTLTGKIQAYMGEDQFYFSPETRPVTQGPFYTSGVGVYKVDTSRSAMALWNMPYEAGQLLQNMLQTTPCTYAGERSDTQSGLPYRQRSLEQSLDIGCNIDVCPHGMANDCLACDLTGTCKNSEMENSE
jgi:hypothetical protein